jgi:hypothetical protein
MSKRRLRKIKWLAQRSMNWKLVAFIFEFRSDQSKVQNLQYLLASIFISLFFPLVSFNLEPYLSYVAFYDFAFCFMSTGQFAVAHPSVWSYLIFCPTSPLWSHSGWAFWAGIRLSVLGKDSGSALCTGQRFELCILGRNAMGAAGSFTELAVRRTGAHFVLILRCLHSSFITW